MADTPFLNIETFDGLGEAMGDEEAFEDLLQEFDVDAKRLLEGLRVAAATGADAELQRHAHTLKSSSGALGATRLSAIVADIERLCRAGDVATAKSLVSGLDVELLHALAAMRKRQSAGRG